MGYVRASAPIPAVVASPPPPWPIGLHVYGAKGDGKHAKGKERREEIGSEVDTVRQKAPRERDAEQAPASEARACCVVVDACVVGIERSTMMAQRKQEGE